MLFHNTIGEYNSYNDELTRRQVMGMAQAQSSQVESTPTLLLIAGGAIVVLSIITIAVVKK